MNNTFRINRHLTVDSGFRDFLVSSPCRVCVVIKSIETLPGIDYIGITDKLDTISYLPSTKVEYIEANGIDPYSNGIGRVYLKIGRLVSKICSKETIDSYISGSDIEEFVNQFKSFFDESNRKLTIVDGEDIRKSYLDRNYIYPDCGTLWKSCMRYKDRQRFLDIYVKNPDIVKMLVMYTNQDGQDKVRARALLWEAEDMKGNKIRVMDRIYTVYDSDVFIFKRWANQNGYITKFYQNAKTQSIFDINNEEVVMNLKVTLPNHNLGTWPYLDTFPFYDMRTGTFYNHENKYYDYILTQSNGGLYPPEPEPEEPDMDDFDFGEVHDDWDN